MRSVRVGIILYIIVLKSGISQKLNTSFKQIEHQVLVLYRSQLSTVPSNTTCHSLFHSAEETDISDIHWFEFRQKRAQKQTGPRVWLEAEFLLEMLPEI